MLPFVRSTFLRFSCVVLVLSVSDRFKLVVKSKTFLCLSFELLDVGSIWLTEPFSEEYCDYSLPKIVRLAPSLFLYVLYQRGEGSPHRPSAVSLIDCGRIRPAAFTEKVLAIVLCFTVE